MLHITTYASKELQTSANEIHVSPLIKHELRKYIHRGLPYLLHYNLKSKHIDAMLTFCFVFSTRKSKGQTSVYRFKAPSDKMDICEPMPPRQLRKNIISFNNLFTWISMLVLIIISENNHFFTQMKGYVLSHDTDTIWCL